MDKFTKAVLKHDGRVCMNPNCEKKSDDIRYRIFDPHHCIPKAKLPNKRDPLRFLPQNGMMLCRVCHDRVDGNSKRPLRGYVFMKWLLDWHKANRPDTYRWKDIHSIINQLATAQKKRQK